MWHNTTLGKSQMPFGVFCVFPTVSCVEKQVFIDLRNIIFQFVLSTAQ